MTFSRASSVAAAAESDFMTWSGDGVKKDSVVRHTSRALGNNVLQNFTSLLKVALLSQSLRLAKQSLIILLILAESLKAVTKRNLIHGRFSTRWKYLLGGLYSTLPVLILDMACRHIRIDLLHDLVYLSRWSIKLWGHGSEIATSVLSFVFGSFVASCAEGGGWASPRLWSPDLMDAG